MKSKRAREADATTEKAVARHDEPAAKKRKRSDGKRVEEVKSKKLKKDKKKDKKKDTKESRRERKDKRKDLLDLPEADASEAQEVTITSAVPGKTDENKGEVPEVDATEEAHKSKKDKKQKKKKDQQLDKEQQQEDVKGTDNDTRQEDDSKKAKETNRSESKKKGKKDKKKNGNKEEKVAVDDDGKALQDNSTTDATAAAAPKDRHIVFVGNLPYSATVQSITAHFRTLKPVSVRCLQNKNDAKPCRGIAFVEFADVRTMRTCLDKFHHTVFEDGVSAGRKINVELTAGGGGKTQFRTDKIREKNKKLDDRRSRRIEKEQQQKAAAQQQQGGGGGGMAGDETNNGSRGDPHGGIHPSRLARLAQ